MKKHCESRLANKIDINKVFFYEKNEIGKMLDLENNTFLKESFRIY